MSKLDAELATLQHSIEQTKLKRAEKLTDLERLRLGADLFDEQMAWIRKAIAADHVDWTPAQVDEEIDRRKRIVRQIDDHGLYKPLESEVFDGED